MAALCAILYVALWMTVFSATTSAIVSVGTCCALVAGSAVSDVFEGIVSILCSVILGILGAIAAVIGFLLSPFQ
jgi:hypothetical protein